MQKQLIGAVAFTALSFIAMALGWYIGGIVGGAIWCVALLFGTGGVGWLLSLAFNIEEWF